MIILSILMFIGLVVIIRSKRVLIKDNRKAFIKGWKLLAYAIIVIASGGWALFIVMLFEFRTIKRLLKEDGRDNVRKDL